MSVWPPGCPTATCEPHTDDNVGPAEASAFISSDQWTPATAGFKPDVSISVEFFVITGGPDSVSMITPRKIMFLALVTFMPVLAWM